MMSVDRRNRFGFDVALTRRDLVRRAGAAGIGAAALGTLLADVTIAGGGTIGADELRLLAAPLEHLEELQELGTNGLVQAMRKRSFSNRNVEAAIVALARAGIATYEEPAATEPMLPVEGDPSPMRFLYWQVRNMALETSTRSGQLGEDLDGLAPAADGAPSVSQAIIAFAESTGTPAADIAQKLIDEPDPNASGETIFPTIVKAFFASELAREAQAANPGALTGEPLTGPCASMQDFVQQVMLTLLITLAALPEEEWEHISQESLEYYRDHLPTTGIPPDLKAEGFAIQIRRAAIVLGIASQIVSLAKAWSLRLEPDPPATRFGVGDEEVVGSVIARMDFGGLTEWPADLVSCSAASNITLPPLTARDDPISWEFTQSPGDLVEIGPEPNALDEEGKALVGYITNKESPEDAQGEERTGRFIVKATATRTSVMSLYADLVDAAFDAIFGNPVLHQALDDLSDGTFKQLAALYRVTGTGVVAVTYHEKKKEKVTATTRTTSPAIGTDRRLVGIWQVADLTGLLDAVEATMDFGVGPLNFVHQSGTQLFTFHEDGTLEVAASDFTIGGRFEDPQIGVIDSAMIFNGTATGVYTADGSTVTITYSGGDFWGVIAVTSAALSNNLPLEDPIGRFLPHGSIAYTVSGGSLELLTNPAAGVPVVLVKVG